MRDGQPSSTARGAAAYRAVHQTHEGAAIFRDPFALQILDEDTRAMLDAVAADPSRRGMRLFVVSRSRFSEEALAASVARGTRQVVVLGAGLDTFALRNPFPDVRVFEVDFPATQAWKRERLREAGLAIARHADVCARRFRARKPCRRPRAGRVSLRSAGILSMAWRRAISDA